MDPAVVLDFNGDDLPHDSEGIPGTQLAVECVRKVLAGDNECGDWGVREGVLGAVADSDEIALHLQPEGPVEGFPGDPADEVRLPADQGGPDLDLGPRDTARVLGPTRQLRGQAVVQSAAERLV